MDPRERDRQIALEILRYAAKHPEAKDSVRGIRLWWLEEPEQWTEVEVNRAASALVDRGLLCMWEPIPGALVLGPTGEFLQSSSRWLSDLDSVSFR